MPEKEYIEREALIHKLNNLTTEFLEHNTVQGGIAAGVAIGIRDDVVATAPTADVAEVKRGEWIECMYDHSYYKCACSECGNEPLRNQYNGLEVFSNYCPNCGAKMDGGDKDG